MRQLINIHGLLTFGAHKNKRPDQAPEGWIEWAKENVAGFSEQLQRLQTKRAEAPKARKYTLLPRTK
jgi:hypothetical protein